MPEFIDRQELIDNLNKFAPEHYNALVNQLIMKQPIADVVEVVRCKDCKYWSGEYRFCKCFGLDSYGSSQFYEESFCSYGERESDNDN